MGRSSSLAGHPQRQRIIDALLAEQPYRIIQEWTVPRVSTGALARFKRSAMAELAGAPRSKSAQQTERALIDNRSNNGANSATRAALTAQSSPFRSRLEQMWGRAERSMDRAETAVRVTMDKESGEYLVAGQDVAAIAPLMAQAHKNLELLGRATGELASTDQNVTNVMVVIPQASAQPSSQPDDVLTIDIGPK